MKGIKENYAKAMARVEGSPSRIVGLLEIFGDVLDDEDDEEPCLICEL